MCILTLITKIFRGKYFYKNILINLVSKYLCWQYLWLIVVERLLELNLKIIDKTWAIQIPSYWKQVTMHWVWERVFNRLLRLIWVGWNMLCWHSRRHFVVPVIRLSSIIDTLVGSGQVWYWNIVISVTTMAGPDTLAQQLS